MVLIHQRYNGQSDGRHAISIPRTLHYSASRGKNESKTV